MRDIFASVNKMNAGSLTIPDSTDYIWTDINN